jgi:hypothetical protein
VAIVDKFGFQFRQYFTTFVIPESTKISLKSQNKKNKMTQVEPILKRIKSFRDFSIKHHDIWEWYKKDGS